MKNLYFALILLIILLASCAEGDYNNGIPEVTLPPVATPQPAPQSTPTPTPAHPATPVYIPIPPLMPEGVYDFPTLHLYSEYHPFEVHRQLWHNGYMRVTGVNDPFIIRGEPIRLRGRGATTWASGPEKRPLRLRFTTPRRILDSPYSSRDWVLIANLFDPSLSRTHLAFYFADMLDGLYWTPFSRLVHVYINDEYKGVYQLACSREISSSRIDLFYHSDPAYSGFFFEIAGFYPIRDMRIARGEVEGVDFLFFNDWHINVRFPEDYMRGEHMRYLADYLQRVDDALKSQDFAALESLVYIPSLVDFYLVQEWFKEIDVSGHSIFMQIKGTGDERRLHFGPVWDFDRSAGNTAFWYNPGDIFAGRRNDWFAAFVEIPEARELVAARWHEIRHTYVEKTLDYAQYLLNNYEEAFNRNFEKHDHILGGEPDWNRFTPQPIRELVTFREQMEHLILWLDARATWLYNYWANEP